MDSFSKGIDTIVRVCMGVRKGETITVITDPQRKKIGQAISERAREVGAEGILVEIKERTRHGEEPPDAVAMMMRHSDVVIAPTIYSLSHTQARKEACIAGARVATLPGIKEDMIGEGGMLADYNRVSELSKEMAELQTTGSEVKIVTDGGTNLKFSLGGREGHADGGLILEKGGFGNLPAGEAYIAPLEGTAEGIMVVDGALLGLIETPITLEVSKGYVTGISGGNEAEDLKNYFKRVGRNVTDPDSIYNIAEFGIGTNEWAILRGQPLEDEKVFGTVHIGIGDNSTFGGDVKAGSHIDAILKTPSVWIDGERVFHEGKYLK